MSPRRLVSVLFFSLTLYCIVCSACVSAEFYKDSYAGKDGAVLNTGQNTFIPLVISDSGSGQARVTGFQKKFTAGPGLFSFYKTVSEQPVSTVSAAVCRHSSNKYLKRLIILQTLV
ncbi:MAG: hypothetical protein M0P01_05460 [Treponema sp.]|nr:hypothetical protein [Treponema sp.]